MTYLLTMFFGIVVATLVTATTMLLSHPSRATLPTVRPGSPALDMLRLLNPLQTQPKQLSIVIPLTLKDIDRFSISFQLLCEAFADDIHNLEEVLLVVPDTEAPYFNHFTTNTPLHKTRVIPESEIIGNVDEWWPENWPSSWELQMLIKIQVVKHLKTHFFLVLDADILPAKHLKVSDFFNKQGKARAYSEPMAVHVDWWNASKSFLNITMNECTDPDSLRMHGFGVTPAVLSSHIANSLLDTLHRVGGENWDAYMLEWLIAHPNTTWTEYSLYRTVSCLDYMFETYHFHDAPWAHRKIEDEVNRNLYDERSLWTGNSLRKRGGLEEAIKEMSETTEEERPLFMIVQSTLDEKEGLTPSSLGKMLQKYPLFS